MKKIHKYKYSKYKYKYLKLLGGNLNIEINFIDGSNISVSIPYDCTFGDLKRIIIEKTGKSIDGFIDSNQNTDDVSYKPEGDKITDRIKHRPIVLIAILKDNTINLNWKSNSPNYPIPQYIPSINLDKTQTGKELKELLVEVLRKRIRKNKPDYQYGSLPTYREIRLLVNINKRLIYINDDTNLKDVLTISPVDIFYYPRNRMWIDPTLLRTRPDLANSLFTDTEPIDRFINIKLRCMSNTYIINNISPGDTIEILKKLVEDIINVPNIFQEPRPLGHLICKGRYLRNLNSDLNTSSAVNTLYDYNIRNDDEIELQFDDRNPIFEHLVNHMYVSKGRFELDNNQFITWDTIFE